MAVTRVNGWTHVTPSADSRLIYISNTGNDAQAKAVKGRGYYLPSDPEIGPDPQNPIGPIVSYVTPREAAKKMRGSGWLRTDENGREIVSITERDRRNNLESPSGGGWPDWVMFKRGETFVGDEGYQSPGWAFLGGNLGEIFRHGWGDNIVAGGAFRYEAGFLMGRSEDEPMVISAWGNPSDPRPIMSGGFTIAYYNFTVVSSLDIQPNQTSRSGMQFGNANPIGYNWWKTIVEDCRSEGHPMIAIQGGDRKVDLTIRRCVFADGWSAGGHNSSPFNGLNDGAKLTIEECVFDRNGYKENPADATKWTAKFSSSLSMGELPDGTGVQPTRTWFDRNWYMSGDAGDTLVLRGNIAARTGGGAEQLRSGGLAYRNVFLFNHDGVLMGASDGYGFHNTFVVQNLFLHDDLFLPPGGWGMNNYGQGADMVIAENIYAHPHSRIVGANGPGTLFLWNARNNFIYKRIVVGNVIRAATSFRGYGTQRSLESRDHPTITIKNNEFAIDILGGYGYGAISRTEKSPLDTVDENYYFGNPTSSAFTVGYGGSPQIISQQNKSFQTWQAEGYDTNSQMIDNWDFFKSTAGWTDPDRDIVSYMQTVDPNYVPDENVRVDYGTKVQQTIPQLVKNVIPPNHMNEEQRLLAARRFHAAVTFLLRARENRKGKWSDNYTAEALNNYIREGFGKPLVGGAYTLTLDDAFSIIDNEIPNSTEPPITPEPEPVTPEPEPVTPEPEPVTPEPEPVTPEPEPVTPEPEPVTPEPEPVTPEPEPVTPEPEPVTPEPEPVTPEPEPVTPEPEPVTPEPEPVTPVTPEENQMENDFVSLEVLNNTSINKVITKTENSVCLVDLYENEELITKIETSSTPEYVFLKVKNLKQVGETIEFKLSPNNQNKAIRFTSYF